MAVQVVMPKLGNSVESCIIVDWKKKEGDKIAVGETLCEAETDKSTLEVASTADGTILKLLYAQGDDVPVMLPIAIVGEPGEKFEIPSTAAGTAAVAEQAAPAAEPAKAETPAAAVAEGVKGSEHASPRARALADKEGVVLSEVGATGPKGRVIERDVENYLANREPLSAAAKEMAAAGTVAPAFGTGIGGRVLARDMVAACNSEEEVAAVASGAALAFPGEIEEIPVKGVRKVTGKRMMESIHGTCQLSMTAWADASKIKALRAEFKNAPEALGVNKITVNDLVMYAVSRTLTQFPEFNAHFKGDKIVRFKSVHLGMATDTSHGLLVPVIKNADRLSLKGISSESKRLGALCSEGKAQPDDLGGSTFTVSNVGAFGVENFTPVINIPEVAILGVGAIVPKAYNGPDGVVFKDSICFSLTIDHQALDGAPGAKFLKALCENVARIDTLWAFCG